MQRPANINDNTNSWIFFLAFTPCTLLIKVTDKYELTHASQQRQYEVHTSTICMERLSVLPLWNWINYLETDPSVCVTLVYDRKGTVSQWQSLQLFHEWCWTHGFPYIWGKIKLVPDLIPYDVHKQTLKKHWNY